MPTDVFSVRLDGELRDRVEERMVQRGITQRSEYLRALILQDTAQAPISVGVGVPRGPFSVDSAGGVHDGGTEILVVDGERCVHPIGLRRSTARGTFCGVENCGAHLGP